MISVVFRNNVLLLHIHFRVVYLPCDKKKKKIGMQLLSTKNKYSYYRDVDEGKSSLNRT